MKMSLRKKIIIINFVILTLSITVTVLIMVLLNDRPVPVYYKMVPAVLSAFAVILLASVPLSTYITKPIYNLQKSVEKIAHGDLDINIDLSSYNEIDQLSSDIDTMLREVKKRIGLMEFERAKLDAVLESMGEGVVGLNSRSRIIAVNSRALSLMDKKLTLELKQISARVIESNVKIIEEVYSEDRCLLVCGTPLSVPDSDGEGTVIILNDITELRKLQEKQKHFMSNVSHELKTPLTTIIGYIDILREQSDNKELFKMSLNYMESASDRLLSLVSDLVELSSMNKTEFEIHKRHTDIAEIAKDIVGQMSIKASKFNTLLTADIPESLYAHVDPLRIKQVLVNIIDNAIKYSPEAKVHVHILTQEKYVVIKVSDTGIGMGESDIEKIFEPFYRVDKARISNMGGSGLGLAITKQIIDKHDGRISVFSKEEKGTVVTVRFPATSETDDAEECAAAISQKD